MVLRHNGWYEAKKGNHFVLTEKGKKECPSYQNMIVGEPVDTYDCEATGWAVENGYVEETGIPGWTTLTGYEVVYYHKGYRLSAGNPMVFPNETMAKKYKKHVEASPWVHKLLSIEPVEYEGVPLPDPVIYRGKEVIDKGHYFGLDVCECGDYFAQEVVDMLINTLPPRCLKSGYFQMGEPREGCPDEHNQWKNVYATFQQVERDIWVFLGYCFYCGTQNAIRCYNSDEPECMTLQI